MNNNNIKSELKAALKNLDLTTATVKDIQTAVNKNSPQIYSEVISKMADIEKVLKNRDLSQKLNYDNCYILAIN